jgi:hypothetical protein
MSEFIFGKIYPWVSDIALLIFLLDVIIFLPASFFKKARKFSGLGITYSSYLFGLQLWLSGLMITLGTWGIWAVIIGVLLLGVGVIPIALIATLSHGMWRLFIELLLSIILIFACRALGAYVLGRSQ